MADVDISIGITKTNAKSFIDSLVAALRRLKNVGNEAGTSRAGALAARARVNALREELLLSQQLLKKRIDAHSGLKKLLDAELADAKKSSAQTIATLEKEVAARENASARSQRAQELRVDRAKAAVEKEIAVQKKLVDAVKGVAEKRTADAQRLADAETKAAKIRAVNEERRQASLERARDRERRRISDQRIIEKGILEQQQKQLLAAKTGKPEGRETARLQERIKFSKSLIKDLDTERKELDRTHEIRIKQQADLATGARKSANLIQKEQGKLVAGTVELGKKEVKAAEETATKTVAARKLRLAGAEEELKVRTRTFTQLRDKGRQEVAAAKASGEANLSTIRAQNKAEIGRAATAVRTARSNVNSKRDEVTAANRAATAQERASQRAIAALRRQSNVIPLVGRSYQSLRNEVLKLASAYAGLQAIRGFIARGLEFNALIESSKLGIAALITAQADLIDQQGKLLTGSEALAAAQGLAGRQLDKLRVAGIQTAATTKELVQTFQETVGAGLNVGLTLDQIRKFSVQIALAGQAINLPMNQLQQESRSILSSTIDRNSRLAKTLNLTNAIVNQAKAEGRLVELLNERFSAFNVAAIESVKTWNTLGSTIKDALDVLAGRATEPLFEDMKKAGQEAIGRIFDFDTAEIKEGFQGLIQGLQIIFGQIGTVFRISIRKAVDGAEALSRWFSENRREVQETAGAIATMVQEFGKMIGQIVIGVGEMLSLGRSTNTVIGAARTLTALFRAIGENVRVIVALLGSAVLLGNLRKIIQTFALLRLASVGIGVAGAAALIPGVGQAIAVIIGLATAYKLLNGSQQDVAVETARLGDELFDQTLQATDLTATIIALEAELKRADLSKKERIELEKEWFKVQQQLKKLGPEYGRIIDANTKDITKQREELVKLMKQKAADIAMTMSLAKIEINRLKAKQAELKKTADAEEKARPRAPTGAEGVGFLGTIPTGTGKAKAALEEATNALKVLEAQADATEQQYIELIGIITKLLVPPEVSPRKPPPEEEVGGEPAFVKAARAQLERVKAEIELEKSLAEADFARGVIDRTEANKRIHAAERVEFLAEQELINALRKKAEADLAAAEKKKGAEGKKAAAAARDQLAALLIQEGTIKAKQKKLDADYNQTILEDRRETFKRLEEIHIAHLRATGQGLEAARREIALEGEETIRDAIRDSGMSAELKEELSQLFGPEFRQKLQERFEDLPPIVQEVIITVDAGETQKQLDVIDDLIRNAEETRNREVEAIRARFSAKGKVKGGLSDAEKQEQVDLIAAASVRAEAAVGGLRTELVLMRAELDPVKFAGTIVIIDGLIARIDGITAATESLNLRLEELKKQAQDALEQGLAQFLEGVGDSTRTLKGLFKEMVVSIINDLRRLSAAFLAKSIIGAIFKAGSQTAVDTGITGATGGSTQSLVARAFQRRAGGGPGRPAHGVLRGGSYGRDSIPIMAMADEYFVKRKATQYYGADFLDAINQMRIPLSWANEVFSLMHSHWSPRPIRDRHHFAQGGAVIGGRSGGARPAVPQTVTHLIGVDENGLIGFMNGRGGRQIVLGHVSSAPRLIANMPRSLKRAR